MFEVIRNNLQIINPKRWYQDLKKKYDINQLILSFVTFIFNLAFFLFDIHVLKILKWKANIYLVFQSYTPFNFIIWGKTTQSKQVKGQNDSIGVRLGLWCLMPLSTIFQLYRVGQFYWWMKPRVPREIHRPITSHWQTWSHQVVLSTHRHEWGSNSQL